MTSMQSNRIREALRPRSSSSTIGKNRGADDGVHLRTCSGSLSLLLGVWIFCFAIAAAKALLPTVCTAQDTTTLFTALAAPNCSSITILGKGFTLSQREVQQAVARAVDRRVRVSRNVTLMGEFVYTTLDMAYLKRRIQMERDNVFTVRQLVVLHSRQPSSTSSGSFDIISMDVGSVLVLQNVVLIYATCAPMSYVVRFVNNVKRPAGDTGKQTVTALSNYCVPSLERPPPRCFPTAAVDMIDFAMDGSTLDNIGVRITIGSVYNYNTTFACEAELTADCVSKVGLATCVQELVQQQGMSVWDSYDLQVETEGDKGVPVLAVVLSCVLGGLAVLALAVLGVMCWRQRRSAAAADHRLANGGDVCPNGSGSSFPDAAAAAAATDDAKPDGRTVSDTWGSAEDAPRVFPKGSPYAGPGGGGATGAEVGLVVGGGANGKAGGGGGKMELLLSNPLLAQPSSAYSSGPGIALNMVLGVDVIASREAVVGRGTFATVLEGHLAGRRVAVKLFHRDALGSTADDVKNLKQEIAILARCQHPNVVTLLGAGSTSAGDEVFLVEELMVTNLARACHEGKGLSLHRVLSVARDIAAGLAYLHPTVIHRDLKPANVLLDPSGTAKLTDFGLSRLWASTVHTANPEAGTVQYMAPECFNGSLSTDGLGKIAISHLSDIFSFGVVLWEMLTRERPWKGMTSIKVALAVGYEQQRLTIPDGDSERFHPKLRKLILQCWDADPRKRPGAAEVAKRLSLLLQQLETHGSLGGPSAIGLSPTHAGGEGAVGTGTGTPTGPVSGSSGAGPERAESSNSNNNNDNRALSGTGAVGMIALGGFPAAAGAAAAVQLPPSTSSPGASSAEV